MSKLSIILPEIFFRVNTILIKCKFKTITVFKPKDAPQKLLKEGAEETKRLIDLFDHYEDYRKGIKKFEFNSKIYGHKKVKNALIKAQHGKCCFCERKTEVGDVEHYRGKGGYQQSSSDIVIKPGYYWLAYDWSWKS